MTQQCPHPGQVTACIHHTEAVGLCIRFLLHFLYREPPIEPQLGPAQGHARPISNSWGCLTLEVEGPSTRVSWLTHHSFPNHHSGCSWGWQAACTGSISASCLDSLHACCPLLSLSSCTPCLGNPTGAAEGATSKTEGEGLPFVTTFCNVCTPE